jgi:hypothetical protein
VVHKWGSLKHTVFFDAEELEDEEVDDEDDDDDDGVDEEVEVEPVLVLLWLVDEDDDEVDVVEAEAVWGRGGAPLEVDVDDEVDVDVDVDWEVSGAVLAVGRFHVVVREAWCTKYSRCVFGSTYHCTTLSTSLPSLLVGVGYHTLRSQPSGSSWLTGRTQVVTLFTWSM